ncbi:flagellar motor protein MotB [Marinicrinis sediminis]|uniref:Flagellar motor protein MotB n=1 Tax=Marinicrinis sediminis TaxID=1652465 RepID=A0ABW5RFQ4_9BACL
MKKRKEHHEEHIDETWLIPYADLLTLLLALFIVLFASSQIDQKKFDELKRSMNSAFNGGASFFDSTSAVQISDLGVDSDPGDSEAEYEEPPGQAGQNNNNNPDTAQAPDSAEQERIKEEEARKALMEKEQQELETLKKQLDQYIAQNGLTSQLGTKLNQSSLMITIRDNAVFPSGSASVKSEAEKVAKAIGQMLEGYPEYKVLVAGHTDNVPISTEEFPSNWDLSSKRALNFMKIILGNTSLDPKNFSPIGYGEYHPIADNSTNAGRQQNRRVEVSILRNFTDEKIEVSTVN